MTANFIPLFAAVSAALIAGYFSFVTLINSKEQKTSEFRQDWIDSLRKEIAEFTSSVYFIKFYYQQGAKNNDSDFIKGLEEIHNKYTSACTAILLRVNAAEKNKKLKVINDDFLRALSDVQNFVNAAKYNEAAAGCDAIINRAKPLLKEEWKRVKRGELSYQVIKYFSMVLFLVTVFFALHIVADTPYDINRDSPSNTDAVANSKAGKTDNSQNCTLSVQMEPSKPAKLIGTKKKENKCNDSSEKLP